MVPCVWCGYVILKLFFLIQLRTALLHIKEKMYFQNIHSWSKFFGYDAYPFTLTMQYLSFTLTTLSISL
jgi:hypothetical protein